MSTLTQFVSTGIKSVQSGTTVVGYNTSPLSVTISSVNTAKAFAIINGIDAATNVNAAALYPKVVLSSATTLALSQTNFYNSATFSISWTVVEYY